MLKTVRFACFFALFWAGCGAPQATVQKSFDPTREPWYAEATTELVALNRQAEVLLAQNKKEEAGKVIEKGQALMTRLLTAPKPPLGTLEAVSDLDQLYGQMLLANRHYGWARLVFQKNLARWKNVEPQTEGSIKRRKEAEAALAECDRAIAAP